MAVYKVPQDVEADDKLIGPFSFRQFIYLIIVALAGGLAWGLSQVFIGLAIIPLPIILLFGALALPIRKDQPMEIYLAALVSFYLKPHRRLWDPDGIDSFIQITVPKTVEIQRSKNISQEDAEQRFSYLANLVDSEGWSTRGMGTNTAMNSDAYLEAQGTEDILDTNNSVAQSFNSLMSQRTEQVRENAIERMHQPIPVATAPASAATPSYNPYPTSMQQTVIQPVDDPSHVYTTPIVQPDPTAAPTPQTQTPPTTSDNQPSADIMNLANNTDLSIETIAREAHRIQEKNEALQEEVVISLR
jgi:hypothetical protein